MAASSKELAHFQRGMYTFALCEGLIFWYSIEKLFQQSVGLSIASIVFIGIVAQTGRMLFEIPSSILADRWHRRNMLILASGIMIIASIVIPLTRTPSSYALAVLLWTIYFAFKSGTDAAFIFDSLKAHKAESSFERVFARYGTLEFVGLIVSSLAAGLIASTTNLTVPFWLTVAPLLTGIIVLSRLPEPPVERKRGESWWSHTGQAWAEVKKNGIVWVMLLYSVMFAMQFLWYEYYQLYGLAVAVPEVWFGSILAVLCLGLIVGSEIVRKFSISKKTAVVLWAIITVTHLGGLLISQAFGFLLALFVTMASLRMLGLGFINVINQNIGSRRRATVISLGGSASQLLFLGFALIFRIAINKFGAPTAFAISSVPLLVLGMVDIIRRTPWVTEKMKVKPIPPVVDI